MLTTKPLTLCSYVSLIIGVLSFLFNFLIHIYNDAGKLQESLEFMVKLNFYGFKTFMMLLGSFKPASSTRGLSMVELAITLVEL